MAAVSVVHLNPAYFEYFFGCASGVHGSKPTMCRAFNQPNKSALKHSFDFGVGTSSVTSGRAAPALALGIESSSWGVLFRSVGVQTTIYAQNSWTLGGYYKVLNEPVGFFTASLGAGLGAAYILRSYRDSPLNTATSEGDVVAGPSFLFKMQFSRFYLGFDALLGLNTNVIQHVALNFQDVSHFTIGISL